MDAGALVADLVAWYRVHRRELPWRQTRDPYAIWVSEVMLQQTRVDTVLPRWQRWLDRFPTVSALAAAPEDDVLGEWAGLGYYARARNLHAAARECAAQYGGRVPDDADAVRALPGVGRYTAGAILSIAFDRTEPVVDGNVIRVLSRLGRVGGDARKGPAQRALWQAAQSLVDIARGVGAAPAEVNQALMELGATVCSPRAPRCSECPVARHCEAFLDGTVDLYPQLVRARAAASEPRLAVAITRPGSDEILALRNPPSGLWGGLYELPQGPLLDGESPHDAAARIALERAGLAVTALPARPLGPFDHVLSHRRFGYSVVRATVAAARPRVRRAGYDTHRWLTPDALLRTSTLGVSQLTRRILTALAQSTLEPELPHV